MPGAHMPFAGSFSLEHGELADAVFTARVVERGLPFALADNWATQTKAIELEGDRTFVSAHRWGRTEVIDVVDGLVCVGLQMGQVVVRVAAATEERAGGLMQQLRDTLLAPDPSSRQEVTVTFWTYGPHGPQPSWRTISVPEWQEIEQNYTAPVRDSLAPLKTRFRPAHGGQLVLWHGASGTGKTFALRALAWEWRDWCEIHYVVDPDSFFGEHADYLMHVLLQSEVSDVGWTGYASMGGGAIGLRTVVSVGDDPTDETAEQRPRDWRLLVLEDTGELLQPDAKAVIGQGLGRFLNLVDGLIGQGLRVLVLVTTNEEIRKLHPAVARPGRCAANIEFAPLTERESAEWLGARDVSAPADRAMTVAELYGLAEGAELPKTSVPFSEDGES